MKTYLQDGVFVAAAYHWALHWLFVFDGVVNHSHGCLLVIGMLALPEVKALKSPPKKTWSIQTDLFVTLSSVISALLQGSV